MKEAIGFKGRMQQLGMRAGIKQRIFIGVFLSMFLAGLSLHFLVGRRAFNPLFEEVTQRRVQTVALVARSIEASPRPRQTAKELNERLGLEIKVVDEDVYLERKRDRQHPGKQFTMDGYEITAYRFSKAPLLTHVDIGGETKVLLVRFPVDIEHIKRQRGLDFLIILGVLIAFSAWISRWAFRPLHKATLAMDEIASGNLSHRVEDNIGSARQSFNQMADRVVQMLEGQRLLLAGISHELRTPLARMRLQTALLEKTVDTTSLHEEIQEMDALVEMLLLSSQLQSGSFEIHPATLDVQAQVLEVIAEVDLGERYLSLQIEDGLCVSADPLLFRRILFNLCSNIAKYTPNDCSLEISAHSTENSVDICCSDTGSGVSDEMLHHLLDPFWRADQSRSKSAVGTRGHLAKSGWGLGLSFVQQAMEAHQGRITLQHNQPSGLNVELSFPHLSKPTVL